jgi:polyisoprenoid-binding protein YceI
MTTTEMQAVPAGTWSVDRVHSTIGFSVEYMAGAFAGTFSDFDVSVADGVLKGTAKVASVQVKDPNLEAHLQTPDFFDAERYPEITFASTRFEPGKVVGDLTIRGVTREVELAATVTGAGTDPWGNERLGLELEGEIDRNDFGVSWNTPIPTGGLLLGDTVRLTAGFSAVKEA